MEKRLYITTNLVNGKVYAGKHFWKEGTNYMGSGYALKKAFLKYGKENFKIRWLRLKIETSEDLDRLEIRLIRLLKYRYGNKCYNIQKGGCGGYFIYYMNDEQRQKVFDKISESKKKQYAEGLTDKQIEGWKRMKDHLSKYRKTQEYKDLYMNIYTPKRIESMKNRRNTHGPTQKELDRHIALIKYSQKFVSYKIIYPDGQEIRETMMLKEFQQKYKTQDNVFSHIRKHGFLVFLQKKNVSKHVFPTGTRLEYISETSGDKI